ncbi:MAG TPA: hypothetical protein VE861_00455 [Gemmatimonadaceae bacterium]|nr:hypothetical protein [Gemmatimonadaceae bacterium]
MNLSSSQLRLLGSVMYFAAAALIINVLADFTIKIWPLKFGELNWRVGAGGLVMDVLLAIIIPQALVYFAAFMNNDRKTIQVLRWIAVFLGLVTIGMLAMFALDSVQIRAQLPQNLKGNFYKVALKAGLVGVLCSILYIWFGLTVGKVLKSQGVARGSAKDAQEGMLMVGTREPARPALRSIDTKELRKDAAPAVDM